jgi:hypothetical protein
MGMDMLGFEVLAYLGMAKNNNGEICVDCPWDDMFAISGVCSVNHGGKHLLITSTGSNGT